MIQLNRIGVYEKAIPEKYSISEALNFAQCAGYDFYEINIDRTEYRINRLYEKNFAREVRSASSSLSFPVESIGLSALSTYTLGNANPEIEKRAVDIFEKTLIFADSIGARIIQIPGCDVPKGGEHTSDTDLRYFDNVMAAAQLASAYGILLGIENMEDSYMNSVKKCSRLIQSVRSPYLQYYPDCGNVKRAFPKNAEEWISDLAIAQGHMLGMHLKETRPEKFGGLFYGKGDVDFAVAVQWAIANNVHRFVMEYWFTGSEQWNQDLKDACRLARSWVKDAKLHGYMEGR